MSYCRFGESSDVYLYLDCNGYVMCCACRLAPIVTGSFLGEPVYLHDSVELHSAEATLAHLAAHRAAGHVVPEYAFARVTKEAAEIDDYIRKGGEP